MSARQGAATEHPIVTAAAEFLKDDRGRKRKRMNSADTQRAEIAVTAYRDFAHGTERSEEPQFSAVRGNVAVDSFEYSDTYDQRAVTVMVDILHSVAQHGYSPQAVINQAVAYYAEER